MKYIASLLLIAVILPAKGQDLDSLKQRILALEYNQKHIQLNLRKSHKEFAAGGLITLAGAVMTAFYFHGKENETGYNDKPTLLYAGLGVSFVGSCIMVDSHKYIGRAGQRMKNPSLK